MCACILLYQRREEIYFSLNLFLVKDKEEKSGEKIEKIFFSIDHDRD